MMWWWRVVDAFENVRPGVGRAAPWSVPHSSTWPVLGAVAAAVMFLVLSGVASSLLPLSGSGTSAGAGGAGAAPATPSSPSAPTSPAPQDSASQNPAPSAPTPTAAAADAPTTPAAPDPRQTPDLPTGTAAQAPPLPPAGTYVWLQDYAGQPVTWDCQPIPWRLVTEDAPAGAQRFVEEAIDRVSAASGGSVVFTQFAPVDTWAEANQGWPGISVGWTAEGWQGSVAGTAETRTRNDEIERVLVRLRLGKHYSEALDFTAEGLGPILVHEIGHAVGLGHVDQSVDSLMTPVNTGIAEFTENDELALAYLGWRACAAA